MADFKPLSPGDMVTHVLEEAPMVVLWSNGREVCVRRLIFGDLTERIYYRFELRV